MVVQVRANACSRGPATNRASATAVGDGERTGTPADGHPAGTSGAPLALSASGHERMVNGRAAASGEKRIDFSEQIAWFGDILNIEGPLLEIGSRSVFANSAVGVR